MEYQDCYAVKFRFIQIVAIPKILCLFCCSKWHSNQLSIEWNLHLKIVRPLCKSEKKTVALIQKNSFLPELFC
jgi:hypothetical protein